MYGNQINGGTAMNISGSAQFGGKLSGQTAAAVPQVASEPEVLRLLNEIDQAVSAAHSWLDTLQGRLGKVTRADMDKAPEAPVMAGNTELGHILASQCDRIRGICLRLSNQVERLEI